MELKEYILKYHKGNLSAFARASGVPNMNVSRYVRGGMPSPEYIQKITDATKGKVALKDFLRQSA